MIIILQRRAGCPGASSRKTRIETEFVGYCFYRGYGPGASSRKTRIETEDFEWKAMAGGKSGREFQKNKD